MLRLPLCFGRFLTISLIGLLLAPFANSYGAAGDAVDPFARPPELERDVRFWIRVYTEVTTDQGLLHDDWNLGVVYEVLRFDPGSSPSQRERRVAEAKAHYAALLRRFAAGATDDLTPHEQRILHAFGANATAADYREAIEHIRFQLGQADRFHEGLIRAAVWEQQIARTLAQHGVPVEIAALPHVESSFNLAAYSKVGAAGLWQFMPGTAKRYMRVDALVDERLDPYRATEAAANLMLYNYRLVGTWPLAVTAYNHGPGGLRQIQDELGTSDIAVVVKRYRGATFGFASRNFYVAFLAALEVDRNAEKYFGPIQRLPDTDSTPVELPDYISVEALARAFKVDMGALRVLNPALRPPIWSGSRLVPRGYSLRLPGTPPQSEIAAAWLRLPATQRYLAQRNDGTHKMRKGETLAGVASASGISLSRLLAANGWTSANSAGRGTAVRIPMPASRAEVGGSPAAVAAQAAAEAAQGGSSEIPLTAGNGTAGPVSPAPAAMTAPPSAVAGTLQMASNGSAGLVRPVSVSMTAPPSAAAGTHRTASNGAGGKAALPAPLAAAVPPPAPVVEKVAPPPKEPVSERQTNANALLPVASPTGSSDTTNYDIAADNTAVVQAAETLGHFADWTKVDSQALRALNKLRKNAMVTQGKRIKLDLSQVTAAQFVAARREYHRHLQESFFAAHRIAGTETYAVKRGDSLWTIAQQKSDLPVWLVAQYNPDANFNDMRPGSTITLPDVVAVNRQ